MAVLAPAGQEPAEVWHEEVYREEAVGLDAAGRPGGGEPSDEFGIDSHGEHCVRRDNFAGA